MSATSHLEEYDLPNPIRPKEASAFGKNIHLPLCPHTYLRILFDVSKGVCSRIIHYYHRKAILLSTALNKLQIMEASQSAAATNTEVSSLREIIMWHLYSMHRRKCHFICFMGRIFFLKSPQGISK